MNPPRSSSAHANEPRGGLLIADLDVLAELRSLAPKRATTLSEARAVAERQAGLLLDLLHISEPPVPQFVMSSLPGIAVDWKDDWPTSGMAMQSESHWRIVLNSSEPRQRQRFTLAHEFKHVLDDPVIEVAMSHIKEHRRYDRAEQICNYFAACVLMPRPWIKHDWCGGLQNIRSLTRRYYVSQEAMTTRLHELGLFTAPQRTPRQAARATRREATR